MNESPWVEIKLGDVFANADNMLFLVNEDSGEGILYGLPVRIWRLKKLSIAPECNFWRIYQHSDKMFSYLKELRKVPEPVAFEFLLKELK